MKIIMIEVHVSECGWLESYTLAVRFHSPRSRFSKERYPSKGSRKPTTKRLETRNCLSGTFLLYHRLCPTIIVLPFTLDYEVLGQTCFIVLNLTTYFVHVESRGSSLKQTLRRRYYHSQGQGVLLGSFLKRGFCVSILCPLGVPMKPLEKIFNEGCEGRKGP